MKEITYPTIHLNGTSPEMLSRDYSDAALAVRAAREALSKVEFHSRDYYVTPGSWDKAVKEQRERYAKLEEVEAELMAIAIRANERIKS